MTSFADGEVEARQPSQPVRLRTARLGAADICRASQGRTAVSANAKAATGVLLISVTGRAPQAEATRLHGLRTERSHSSVRDAAHANLPSFMTPFSIRSFQPWPQLVASGDCAPCAGARRCRPRISWRCGRPPKIWAHQTPGARIENDTARHKSSVELLILTAMAFGKPRKSLPFGPRVRDSFGNSGLTEEWHDKSIGAAAIHPAPSCGHPFTRRSAAALRAGRHCDPCGHDRADGRDRRPARRRRRPACACGAPHRGGRPARSRRADHGDRVDQEPAGHLLRCRGLDLPRAGIDRHHRTRDAGRRVRAAGKGQGPPFQPV